MSLFEIDVIKKDKKKVKVEIEAESKDDAIELCKKWYGPESVEKIKEKK